MGKKTTNTFKMIIDSPALIYPQLQLRMEWINPITLISMEKQIMPCGIMSLQNIVIVSSDTDAWVYGLGILEYGWLQEKTVLNREVKIALSTST